MWHKNHLHCQFYLKLPIFALLVIVSISQLFVSNFFRRIKIVIEYFSNISYSISYFLSTWNQQNQRFYQLKFALFYFTHFPSIFIKAIFTSIFWLPLVSSKKHIYPSFTFYSQQHNYKSYFITKWQEFENILIFISYLSCML